MHNSMVYNVEKGWIVRLSILSHDYFATMAFWQDDGLINNLQAKVIGSTIRYFCNKWYKKNLFCTFLIHARLFLAIFKIFRHFQRPTTRKFNFHSKTKLFQITTFATANSRKRRLQWELINYEHSDKPQKAPLALDTREQLPRDLFRYTRLEYFCRTDSCCGRNVKTKQNHQSPYYSNSVHFFGSLTVKHSTSSERAMLMQRS